MGTRRHALQRRQRSQLRQAPWKKSSHACLRVPWWRASAGIVATSSRMSSSVPATPASECSRETSRWCATARRTSSSTSSTRTIGMWLWPWKGRLPIGNLDVHIRPWRVLPYDNPRHQVHLCLEGIPVHAWNESIAKQAMARTCDLDYVEQKSLRRDDTRALCLWAWMNSPSNIPKLTWLTLTGSSLRVHDGLVPPAAAATPPLGSLSIWTW